MTLKGALEKLRPIFLRSKNISIGKNCRFRKWININANSGGKIRIGDGVFMNNGCSINAHELIEIGNNALFGENVCMYDHNYVFTDKSKTISSQGHKTSKIVIGNNCWIGSNVTILRGVEIGDGCIIGANCLIYKDVPPYSIVKNNSQISIEERR